MKTKKRTPRYYLRQNIVISLLLFIPFAMIVVTIIPARAFQLGGTLVSRVDTDEKVVALTFDDGPKPGHTEALISTLQKADVPATFFLIGIEMARHPAETQKLVDAGFEIGNHSYHHDSLVFKSGRQIASEIESTDTIIREHGYLGNIPVRPPYGHKLVGLPSYLGSHNRPTIMWNIAPDENDYNQDPQDIISTTLSSVRPGSIIILHGMHDHNKPVRDALPQLIIELRAQGYRFVTISELLNYR